MDSKNKYNKYLTDSPLYHLKQTRFKQNNSFIQIQHSIRIKTNLNNKITTN